MFRRIKCEFGFICENMPIIGLGAFLCCICGILLWVNGGSTWYIVSVLRNVTTKISLSGIFITWLFVYGLIGVILSLIWLVSRSAGKRFRRCFCSFGLIIMAFILDLSWYAVFCCTRLGFFAAILLIAAVIMCIICLFTMKKTMILLSFAISAVTVIELYFVCFSLSCVM